MSSLVCKQNPLHFHSLSWAFFSTLLPWKFIHAKLRNFTILKRGLVVNFAGLT